MVEVPVDRGRHEEWHNGYWPEGAHPNGFPHNGVYRSGSVRWNAMNRPASHRAEEPRRWSTPPNQRHGRLADATRWHWLLLVPVAVPLLTPLYNRVDPTVLGFPFFYWFQLATAGGSALFLGAVYLLTRKRA